MMFQVLSKIINIRKEIVPISILITLIILSIMLPMSQINFYLYLLFGIGYLQFLLLVDKIQLIPFQTTHNIWLSVFTIPQVIILYRINPVIYTNSIFLYIVQFLSILFIFGFISSNNRMISYIGSIERGIGVQFFINVFINVLSVMYIYSIYGKELILQILFLAQLFEVFTIEKQRQQHKKIHDWKLTYVLEMGDRYVGTLSNPIHTSAYLTTTLPLLLFLVSNNIYTMLLYVGLYFIYSYGIYNTQGRQSTLAYSFESFAIILYLQTLWMNITPWMLAIYSLTPLISLILYYNKFATDNIIRFKQINNKIRKLKTSEDYLQGYEKNNRKMLWKEGIHIILTCFPFVGYGIQNIQNAYNIYSRHQFKLYYNDKTNDSSHNLFIDLGLQQGFFALLLDIILMVQIGYILIVSHQYIIQIAYLTFMIEFMFSFPLQQNYMLMFIILQMQGMNLNYVHILIPYFNYILLSLLGLMIINFYMYIKENKMLQYLQLQTSLNNQGHRYQINLYLEQMNIAIFDSRPWIYIKQLFFDKIAQMKKLQTDDLILLLNIFETNKKQIIQYQENRQQVFYVPINILIILINMYKNNNKVDTKKFKLMQYNYLQEQLKLDPYSIDLRTLYRLYFSLTNNYDNYTKVDDKVQMDIVNLFDMRPNMDLMIKDYLSRRQTGHIVEKIRKIQKERFNIGD